MESKNYLPLTFFLVLILHLAGLLLYDLYLRASGVPGAGASSAFLKTARRSKYLEFSFNKSINIAKLNDDIYEKVLRLPKRIKKNQKSSSKSSGPIQIRLKKTYLDRVYERIARNKHYPDYDREMGNEGLVGVKFSILKNGQLRTLRLVKKTAYPGLQKAALRAIRNAQPFPPLPPELPPEISVSLELDFRED